MEERKKSAKNVYENPLNLNRDLRADGKLDLLPIKDCLTKYAAVKENVFGIEWGLNNPRILSKFKNSFSYPKKYVQDMFELNLTVSYHP